MSDNHYLRGTLASLFITGEIPHSYCQCQQ